ncbi:hypothetical protein SUDANB15_07438 (plasmid) [Streptomyces sp. enrichment culture]|uniref:SagB family peptide dehydrogenase n=1 Tax=Streptomyces sp. enrichment culture TaxID=1795815 RepID=UPI003F574553
MSGTLLSLHPGTTVHDERGLLTVRHRWGSTSVGPAERPLADALHALAAGPVTIGELTGLLRNGARLNGEPAEPYLAFLHHALDTLGHTLHRHVRGAAGAVATAVPLAPEAVPRPGAVPDGPLILDQAAHLRSLDGEFVLESPRSRFRVRLLDPETASMVARLAWPVSRTELEGAGCDETAALLDLLHRTGFVRVPGDAGAGGDAAGLPPGWTFHELLAFDGSRAGRRDRLFGPVFPLRGTEQPEPPCRPLPAGRRVPLNRPELTRTAREDRPFTEVLEDRRSRRAFGDRPLTRRQLGSFLYRAARVRTVLSARSEDDRPYAVTSRPYPSAGSAYELELYAAVRRCGGLDPGLYHYDPLGHALTELPDHPGAMDQLLREASAAAGERAVPDVHLTVVSRIKRLSWKYAAHSYALTLKNTGVLLQTLSLVADAMDLAGCVLGGGDSDTPVRAFGLAPYAEIPVGGFLLGTAVPAGSGEHR